MSDNTLCGRRALGHVLIPNPEFRQGCDKDTPEKIEQKIHGEITFVFADGLSVYLINHERRLVKVAFHTLVLDGPRAPADISESAP